jgi:hypothetical protein
VTSPAVSLGSRPAFYFLRAKESVVEDRDLYLVFSNPVEGREDEYNAWYDEVHLPDVQRIPGVVGANPEQ